MEREIAYQILKEVLIDGKYASLTLKKTLKSVPVERRGFITEIVNGVLRHYYYLEYQFKDDIRPNTKMDLKIILAMALYERFYMRKKDYVANEYIKMIDGKSERGFINALMRKIVSLKEPDMETDEGVAIKYSLPLWIYRMLKAQYPSETLKMILLDLDNIPKVYYRLNHHKATFDDLKDLKITILNEDSFIADSSLVEEKRFKEGYFYIQDINSAKIYKELDLNEDDIFLDLCAAPGSKLFNALDIIRPENAYVNDINPKRAKLISDKAKALGFELANIYTMDASELDEVIIQKATKILIDAPCSGLGVIKRKPEIRYRLQSTDIDDLCDIQSKILDHVLNNMKKEAVLVYSTCTLNTKENERQIKKALKDHPDIKLLNEVMYFDEPSADRFYSAKLSKIS